MSAFLDDALRFMWRNVYIAEQAPLQLYQSALIFTPERSIVRQAFLHESPKSFSRLPTVPLSWGRERQKLGGQSAGTDFIAFSGDSKLIASSSRFGTVIIWDAIIGAERSKLKIYKGMDRAHDVSCLTFSADNMLLAAGADDGSVTIWETSTGMELHKLRIPTQRTKPSCVDFVAFSHDGSLLAAASGHDNCVQIWDTITGLALTRDGWQTAGVRSGPVLDSSNGNIQLVFLGRVAMFAAKPSDDSLELWQISPCRQPHNLEGQSSDVEVADTVPQAVMLKVFSTENNHSPERIYGEHTLAGSEDPDDVLHYPFQRVAFSADGTLLMTSGNCEFGRRVQIWNVLSQEEQIRLQGLSYHVSSFGFSPDNKRIALAFRNGSVWVWNMATGTSTHELDIGLYGDYARSVAFSQDGQLLALASTNSPVRIWDVSASETAITQMTVLEKDEDSSAYQPVFSNDRVLITRSSDGSLSFWDLLTGASLHDGAIPPYGCHQVIAVSEDRALIAVLTNFRESISIWNLTTGTMRHGLGHQGPGDFNYTECMVFSSDNKFFASARGWIVDVKTGAKRARFHHDQYTYAMKFSANSARIAIADSSHIIRILNSRTGTELQRLESCTKLIHRLSFFGNEVLASGSIDGTLRLWDLTTGTLRHQLPMVAETSASLVGSLVFSADGTLLASTAESSSTIRLWDTARGTELQGLEGVPDLFWLTESFSFSPDGKFLLTPSGKFALDPRDKIQPQQPIATAVGLHLRHDWVRYGEEDVLWLPHEYRKKFTVLPDGRLAIVHRSGVISYLALREDEGAQSTTST